MKINRYGSQSVKAERVNISDSGKAHEADLFQVLLDEAGSDQQRSELDRLLQEVNQKGDVLVASQSLDAAYAYRQAVKKYLDILVKGSLSVAAKTSTDRFGRQKIYAVVEEIDRQLIDLIDLVIKGQKEPLQMLKIVGEVKGLLISLHT